MAWARSHPTAMDRTAATVGLHHRWGIPTDPILPPSAQADEQSLSPWREAEVGVGDRLLSCVRIHLQNGRCVIFRPQASSSLGAEDVPLAEKWLFSKACGACGRVRRTFYDHKFRRVRDLSCGDTRVYLEFESRRVSCRNCGTVKQETLN